MHPVLFHLPGGFAVRSFGVMVALGFLLSSWILSRLVRRTSDDPERDAASYGAVSVWVLIGIVLGARLAYVIVEIAKGSDTGQQYLHEPWTILAIWEGGLVMYGGLFGGIAAGVWRVRRERLPVGHSLDLGLTAAFFGYALGRIGCLLVGDDYGKLVPERFRDLPFPITLRVPDPLPEHSLFGAENAGQLLWATQVWMAANGLVLGLLGLALLRRQRFGGQVGLILILGYSITRSAIEVFRGDAVRGVWFGGAVSTSQLISIATGVAALVLLVALRRRADEPAFRAREVAP
jgi:phosphatidylglycerol:prolipoprotein diacylglycerol transferase